MVAIKVPVWRQDADYPRDTQAERSCECEAYTRYVTESLERDEKERPKRGCILSTHRLSSLANDFSQ